LGKEEVRNFSPDMIFESGVAEELGKEREDGCLETPSTFLHLHESENQTSGCREWWIVWKGKGGQ
jgi:hypothetical protein